MIKDHGFIFNEFSVKAILADLKHRTSRIMTPYNSLFDGGPVTKEIKEAWNMFDWDAAWVDPGPSPAGNSGPYLKVKAPMWNTTHRIYPRVQVGDHIWGRETWRTLTGGSVDFRADYTNEFPGLVTWKSPLHLKKKHARIWLEVTAAYPQRIQDITGVQVQTEGIKISHYYCDVADGEFGTHRCDPFPPFIELWNSIHGPDAWDKNQWVWAYEFERIER